MPNVAQTELFPPNLNILIRAVFLYVGQGSSTLLFIKDGARYRVWLVDTNLDKKAGGIDVPRLVKDLLQDADLDAFVNTHPHDDHLRGLEELSEQVTISSIRHSGHKPGRNYDEAYKWLETAMAKVQKRGGDVIIMEGSRTPESVGEAQLHILAPAEYVIDDINDEAPETRYARIHEQCVVLKIGDGVNWIMVAGDADREAFEKHIAQYHQERLSAKVLAAPHHGSRTFFRETEEQDPFLEALEGINPEYVVVSAPTQEESKHEHPHDDAMQLYREHVGTENVFHTGESRCTFIFDIRTDGTCGPPTSDDGRLSEAYGLTDDDDDNQAKGPFISQGSQTGDLTPRKFGSPRLE